MTKTIKNERRIETSSQRLHVNNIKMRFSRTTGSGIGQVPRSDYDGREGRVRCLGAPYILNLSRGIVEISNYASNEQKVCLPNPSCLNMLLVISEIRNFTKNQGFPSGL